MRLDAKYAADTKIADASREFKMKKAGFDVEVNALKAESELAYELQVAKERQKIRAEEIEITVVERKKQIEVTLSFHPAFHPASLPPSIPHCLPTSLPLCIPPCLSLFLALLLVAVSTKTAYL